LSLNQTSIDIFHVANSGALLSEEPSPGSASGYAEIIGPIAAIIVIGALLYCTGCRKKNRRFRVGDVSGNNNNFGYNHNGNNYNGNGNFYNYPPFNNVNNNSNMPVNMPITVPITVPINNTNNVNV
jgi:hypothetical protein